MKEVTTHHKYAPSSMARVMECPGSATGVDDVALSTFMDKPSDASTEGSFLHDVMQGLEDSYDLTSSQRSLIYICEQYEAMRFSDAVNVKSEQKLELWIDGVLITYGTLDKIYEMPKSIEFGDYKFGEYFVPVDNWQFKVYSCMLMDNYNIKETRGHLIQPKLGGARNMMFTEPDKVKSEIVKAIEASEALYPTFKAGGHCTFCPKRLTCSVCLDMQAKAISTTTGAVENAENIILNSYKELGEKLDAWKLVEPIGKTLAAFVKEATVAGEETGYEIRKSKGKRTISSARVAFNKLATDGIMDINTFLGLCSVKLSDITSKVEDAIKAKDDTIKSKKKVDEYVADLLGGTVKTGGMVKRMYKKKSKEEVKSIGKPTS